MGSSAMAGAAATAAPIKALDPKSSFFMIQSPDRRDEGQKFCREAYVLSSNRGFVGGPAGRLAASEGDRRADADFQRVVIVEPGGGAGGEVLDLGIAVDPGIADLGI